MELHDVLREVVGVLDRHAIPYMLVGSFAGSIYGDARFTQDIDIVVELSPNKITDLCAAFPAPDFYLPESMVRDAVNRRWPFNLLHPTSGSKVDFIFTSNDEWGRAQLGQRRRAFLLPDLEGFTARPEDIIISKLRYYEEGGSEKHLIDIAGILRVSVAVIDRPYIENWVHRLGLTAAWQAVLARTGS